MRKKTYLLDTSAILTDRDAISSFGRNDILIPLKVLEEIDELIEAVEGNTNKIQEAADVFYHLIMYLEVNDVKIEDVMEELNKRKK